jgi:hypothetical protein
MWSLRYGTTITYQLGLFLTLRKYYAMSTTEKEIVRRRTKILCIIDLNFYRTVFTSIHNLQIWNNTCGKVLIIFIFARQGGIELGKQRLFTYFISDPSIP